MIAAGSHNHGEDHWLEAMPTTSVIRLRHFTSDKQLVAGMLLRGIGKQLLQFGQITNQVEVWILSKIFVVPRSGGVRLPQRRDGGRNPLFLFRIKIT